MVKTYCCNPFELHTKRVTTRLRVVSEEFVESGLVQSGEAVCSNCATSLRTQKTVEDLKKNHPERFEIGGTPSQTSESTQATDTHSQETIDSDLDEEIASERLKSVLPLLGVSPVKKHGLLKRKLENEMSRKLDMSQKVMRESFEKTYNVSVHSTSEERLER